MIFDAVIKKTTSGYEERSFVCAETWDEAKKLLLKDRGPEWVILSFKQI